MPSRQDHQRDWTHIQQLGLCPAIGCFQDYSEAVTKGEAAASIAILTDPIDVPNIEYIRNIHKIVFEKVHPWAGEFNAEGDDIWFGQMLSCDPTMIRQELDELPLQCRSLQRDAVDYELALMIAWYHAKFERIHPFKDGNGRVGRLLMESQTIALFGPLSNNSYDRLTYTKALVWAQRKSNLRLLANIVLAMANRPALDDGFYRIPFKLTPKSGSPARERQRRMNARHR